MTIKITMISSDGVVHRLTGVAGQSLMQVAVNSNVPGLLAECGGECTCGTCHVLLDEDWISAAGEASEAELDMLDFVDGADTGSRLSCQIKLTEDMNGLTVRVADNQPT